VRALATMAPLLALAALLVPPPASASEPAAPWDVTVTWDRAPAVGEPVVLTVALHARAQLETVVLPDASPWLHGAREPHLLSLREGERREVQWTLTPVHAGLWAFALHTDGFGWCCLRGFAQEDQGVVAPPPFGHPNLPDPQVRAALGVTPGAHGAVAGYAVRAEAPWLETGRLRLEARAWDVVLGEAEVRPPEGRLDVVLRGEGHAVFTTTYWADAGLAHHPGQELAWTVDCRTVAVGEDGRATVRPCHDTERRASWWSLPPAPGAALALALLGLAAARRARL